MIDYYAILSVPPVATPDDIKAAYRARARELHPDVAKTPDATDRMARLNVAYAVLSNPTKRLEYDKARASAPFIPSSNAIVNGVVSVLKSILSDPVAVGAIGELIVNISKHRDKRGLFDEEENDWGL